jgi:hypothetical protein
MADVFRTPDERFQGLDGYAFEPSYPDLDLMAITVVVQDWGGPIGLRCAIENPER